MGKKIIRLTESDLVRLVKKVIQEQSVSFEQKMLKGKTYTGKRSIDEKTYKIKFIEVEEWGALVKITGPGEYQGHDLDGTRRYEVQISVNPLRIGGNQEMGDFTELKNITE